MTRNSVDEDTSAGAVPGFLNRYRRHLIIVAVLVLLYTVAGFFLAPWLVERQAVKAAAEQFDSDLRLGDVAVNPFVLSLRIHDLALDDPVGDPVARIGQIFVNFQSSSLFRWALTFAEFRVESPELFVSRDGEGRFNLERLLAARPPPDPADEPAQEEGGLMRLIVHEVAIVDSALDWRDAVPPEPVATRFGPVDVRVQGLNTLPEQPGTQEVVIRTASEGTLTWSGSLQLNPLRSAGEAAIDGSHFALLSSYIRHETGLDITEGNADIDFTYAVSTAPDGELSVTVDGFDLVLDGVRVQTFPAAADGGSGREPREFLSLPRLALSGGTFRWPERAVSVTDFHLDDAVVDLQRDETGMLDVVRNLPAGEPAEAGPPQTPSAETPERGEPWRLALDAFRLNNLTARLRDESVTPVAETSWESVDLEVRDISNEPGAAFPVTASLQAGRGGTVTAEGELSVLPEAMVDLAIGMDEVALIGMQPYVRPLADVNFDSGDMNMQVRLRSSPEDPLRLEGDLSIDEFLITETDLDTRLGSWDRLAITGLDFSLADETLLVSEVRFERPYGDILITEEGELNLGRVARDDEQSEAAGDDGEREAGKGDGDGDGETGPATEGPDATDGEEAAPPLRVTVGRIVIADASADFADRSLPLPFDVKISKLQGELSTIDTASAEPSRVSAEGTVDEYGFLRVSGSITPLEPARDTDLRAEFENVAMPKFSAYSVPFAGREIASGSLYLDLGYRVDGGRLVGENNIVLREFELGEKVPHPDATSLPLGLAIALLKDSSGTIDVDLPVSGDVNSPEFSVGAIVGKALVNLVVKIATSPFALLGNLLGVEASELEQVSFLPGRADLTPPEMQTAASLAEALTLRPELVLVLPPVHVEDADARALREAKLEAAVEARIEGIPPAAGEEAMYDERLRETLEALYREAAPAEDPGAALEQLRATHTVPASEEQGGEPRLDAPAYTEALRGQLIDLQTLEPGVLEALARERAVGLRDTILAAGSDLEGRVVLAAPGTVELSDKGRVPMRVELKAGAADGNGDGNGDGVGNGDGDGAGEPASSPGPTDAGDAADMPDEPGGDGP